MKCPHCKDIEVVQEFGLTTFKHEGGSYCSLMNSFKTTVSDVLAKLNKKDSEKWFPLYYRNSEEFRQKQYLKFAEMGEKELFDELTKLKGVLNQELLLELIDVFGATIVENMCVVGGRNSNTMGSIMQAAQGIRPKYSMVRLSKETIMDSLSKELSGKIGINADAIKKLASSMGTINTALVQTSNMFKKAAIQAAAQSAAGIARNTAKKTLEGGGDW